jgi:FkbM family methyltransferase
MGDGPIKAFVRRLLPKAAKPHRIMGGQLRGSVIVTSWHDYPAAILGRTEESLVRWFELNVGVGETWLDVGAHYGFTAIALSRLVGRGGRVFAFEPMIATAGYLAQTRSLNSLEQLSIVPMALGSPDTVETYSLPVVRGMVDRTASQGGACEHFLVTRLDWLWNRISGEYRRVDGVKLDVQGMEIEALSGMSSLLREWAPKLVVEIHAGVDRTRLLDVIEQNGYSRAGVGIDRVVETSVGYLDDHSYYFRSVRQEVHQT